MKKILSVLLSCIMIIVSVSGAIPAFALETALESSGACGENASYTFNADTGKLVISGTGNVDTDIFQSNEQIKSVVMENGITGLRKLIFQGCKNINTITMADSVTEVGAGAFSFCTSLENINLSGNIKAISFEMFNNCTSLKNVTIPSGVAEIGQMAFNSCINLKALIIPDGVQEIQAHAFSGCTGLSEMKMPKSVQTINQGAFESCSNLSKLTIENANCVLNENGIAPKTTVIYGHNGSTAQEYAKKFGNKFVSLDVCSNHIWNSGKVTKAATCTATGVKTYTCTVCKATKTEAIAKKAHTYKNYVTKATTSQNGSVVNKCSVCGAKKSTTTVYKISSVALSTTATYYNGKVKTPGVTVKDSKGKTLKKGTDYTVSFASGRKNVGRYAVTVTFKGNYSGKKTLYFNIIPRGVSKINSVTSRSKGFVVNWTKQRTQTTGYQIQYSTNKNMSGAKTITMSKNTYYAKNIKGLKGNKRYYVRIRTYKVTKFNGKNYNIYSPWCATKSVTTKK